MSAPALLSRSEPVFPEADDLGSEPVFPEADDLGVALGSVDTPIGRLQLAATSLGLVRISFGGRETAEDMMAELAEGPHWGGRGCSADKGDSAWLDRPVKQIRQYFDGCRHEFDLALDWRLSRGFYRRVLVTLMAVDYGTTVSYGELARMAGSSRAARAVGTAMSTNPIALVVPCHRVVRSDGSVGEYGGRPEAKAWLISHERAHRG